MAATPTGRVDPNSDPHGLSRWDEGTQVVLVRTDPNHAEMLNEHFHVMEVEREGREVPNGGRIYRLRKWDDHTRVILAHSTALMKATDFVLSNFVKLDASEREEVAHNIFQTCPSLLVERQSPANGPALVTTPRGPRTYASPTRAAKHAGPPPAPGLGAASYSGAAPAENSGPKAPPVALSGLQVQRWGTSTGGSQGPWTSLRADRFEVWPHEPDMETLTETTDIWKFPNAPHGGGVYRTIFVCYNGCGNKWRSPCASGSFPYVSRLVFTLFFCVRVFCFVF